MNKVMKSGYMQLALLNFAILTLFGFLLRYIQLYPIRGVNYQFVLHAHSHFAFAGWVFLAVAILLASVTTDNSYSKGYKVVFVLALISAFGMLLAFSVQGYKFVSITFSTLFIITTYRFSYLVLKDYKSESAITGVSRKLIKSALGFLCLSSLGPFSLAPIAVSGLRESALYQNAIYFYLHFQMNGFMLLAMLGLFASSYLSKPVDKNSSIWLTCFIFSTVPLFFIFTLWAKPASWIWVVAFFGSVINLISWIKLCIYYSKETGGFSLLVKFALLSVTFKIILQTLVCIPAVGEWVFLNRNLIIGYVHLLTLGCISPLILDQFIKRNILPENSVLLTINRFYIFAVILYLLLLFIQPLLSLYLVSVPAYQHIILGLSSVFLLISISYLGSCVNRSRFF